MWLLVCFFLSGVAGLVYQTAWTRQFAFVFGTSELAVATVLAAYMGGLAAGAAVAARLGPSLRRPVRAYALLELGIGVAALLLVPAGIAGARWVYVAWFGQAGAPPGDGGLSTSLFYVAASFLILLVPTGLMGATLPLLARHVVRRQSEIGSHVGMLYAVNAVGAVVGTLVCGFLLLPALGLGRTLWVAAGLNGAVFVAAVILARGLPARPAVETHGAAGDRRHLVLQLMLVSGMVSFTYEVLWTRLLGHVLGGSVYAFATMLASFLTGIAAGSWAASRLAGDAGRSARGLAWAQVGTAALSVLAYLAVDRLPGLMSGGRALTDVALAALTLLPGALCIGATFPFAVSVLARSADDAGPAAARVFAWNTVGAILGAIGAGLWVVPVLGFSGTLTACVALNLVLAAGAAGLAGRAPRPLLAAAVVGLVALALARPSPPWNLLRSSPLTPRPLMGEAVDFRVGRSATVLLVEHGGGWQLRTNGLPESTIQPLGGRAARYGLIHWLGVLPTLLVPETGSMLVVGLGGGLVTESVPAAVSELDVVELEPAVVEANRVIGEQRRRDPLTDPRLRLVLNDARGALLLTGRDYDAIVSQPSHPWTAGSSHLYTREFFELVRSRLSERGVFVQWMATPLIDAELLRTMVATMTDVFPHVNVFRPSPLGLLFAGSQTPLDVGASAAAALAPGDPAFRELGLLVPEDVLAALVLDDAGARAFGRGAVVNTDDQNLMAMRSPSLARGRQALFDPGPALSGHDPLLFRDDLRRVYLVRRLLALGLPERALRMAQQSQGADRHAALGLVELARGRGEAARRQLGRALEREPEHLEARVALWRLDPAGHPLPLPLAAVDDGRRAAARSDWEGLSRLEEPLARIGPREPVFPDAVRLRARWRLELGDQDQARRGLALLDAMLPQTGDFADLLLRADLAVGAGWDRGALTTLFEIADRGLGAPLPAGMAAEVRRRVQALPPGVVPPADRDRLMRRLGVSRP